jgi:hypothetical protein
MKSSKIAPIFLLVALTAGCGGGGSGGGASPLPDGPSTPTVNPSSGNGSVTGNGSDNSSGGTTPPPAVVPGGTAGNLSAGSGSSGVGTGAVSAGTPAVTSKNVLDITVNGSLCSDNSYPNKPCVSVTVCTPGTTTCQTINDILLDTGSYGLRIFKQTLNVPLRQVIGSSGPVAECVQFGDGSSEWGSVQTASVILGNEPSVQVPIQVIDATFGTPSNACRYADKKPSDAGFNGILGVGLFVQDCGPVCSQSDKNGRYYACNGSNCSGTKVTLSSQVQNPVALLPQDNNGVIVQLPGVSSVGAASVNGTLVLGIGTQPNNTPSAVTMYPANQYGEFSTTLNGISYNQSFIDSGSNGLFFPSNSVSPIPDCSSNETWFCPPSITDFFATNTGASGSASGQIPFQIGNFLNLIGSSSNVFINIGGDAPGGFDWGLPFYLGRNVYVGIEGKMSSLGSGPFWAY